MSNVTEDEVRRVAAWAKEHARRIELDNGKRVIREDSLGHHLLRLADSIDWGEDNVYTYRIENTLAMSDQDIVDLEAQQRGVNGLRVSLPEDDGLFEPDIEYDVEVRIRVRK